MSFKNNTNADFFDDGNRFILGTAQFPSLQILLKAIQTSQTKIITLSLSREQQRGNDKNLFWETLKKTNCQLLPNTAGCHNAKQAVTMANMAREIFETNWIKLEVIGDAYNLQPDPIELIKAVRILVEQNFKIWAYTTDDLVICRRLYDMGCFAIMPWGAPIGSGQGLLNESNLIQLRERLADAVLIVDAGIGTPSHAARVMEIGFDAVLINSAIARALQPTLMAAAFSDAIKAGRKGFEAGLIFSQNLARASTPLIDTPFWHETNRCDQKNQLVE